jgi:hypothetical protein
MYLYALIARYAKLNPINRAYVWDNIGESTLNSVVDSSATYSPLWPSADSLKSFHDYVIANGVPADFVIEGSPDSLLTRTTTSTVTTGSTVAPYSFLANHRMVAGIRDTTTAHIFAAPLGVSSVPGNGNLFASHRVAFSAFTGSNDYNARGIYQRLASIDSGYAAKFGPDRISPYLSMPFDWSAPADLRSGATWTGSNTVASNGGCPPESLLMALALAGKTTIRGWTSNLNTTNYGANPLTGANMSSLSTTGSVAPLRLATGPDQSYYVSIPSGWSTAGSTGGNMIRVRFVGAAAFTEPPITSASGGTVSQPNSRLRYAFEATNKLATLFGVVTPVPSSYATQALYGEAALGATYSTQTPLSRNSDFGRCRIANMWPQYLRFPASTIWTNYQASKEHARIALFSPLAALNNIAGHPLIQWVQPWQVYDK